MPEEKGKVAVIFREELKLVYEDEGVIVLEKPSGWVVNSSLTSGSTPVVQDFIFSRFNFPISKNKELRSGIVHRLDKDTSGLLLVAKTEFAFRELQRQFKERRVKKGYLALVHRKLSGKEGEIKVPVGRLPWNRERFGVLVGGREAITKYRVLKYLRRPDGEIFSLIKVFPKTGRTHQIRVHFKYIGHPLVSDPFYVGRKNLRRDLSWCPRLFLHAFFLAFDSPLSCKRVRVKVDLDIKLQNVLSLLSEVDDFN